MSLRVSLALCFVLPFAARSFAQAPAPDADSGWPRVFADGPREITIYQPQVESWKDNRIEERSAVGVSTPGAVEPTYGVVWLTARTDVDKSGRTVALEDLQVTRVEFPTLPAQSDELKKAIEQEGAALLRPVSLDRLQASLAVAQAEEKRPARAELKNDVPQIFVADGPAYLLLIDGDPVLRESGTTGVLRVVNTRSLVLLDRSDGKYFLRLGTRWLTGRGATGPWKRVAHASTSLEKARLAAESAKAVDDVQDPALLAALKAGKTPRVFASTSPAELIETRGKPELTPIADTRLLTVKNTSNDLVYSTSDQNYYVLFSGRWYHARALDGPWAFVAANNLPSDFSRIPASGPEGGVLTSVAGTPESQEAAIGEQIPQTATISRAQAAPAISYDGAPAFRPIEGTALNYAANSATPVIEVSPQAYYAVENGIWFVAASPAGPWTVAAYVPPSVYSIPPNSPLYYVTYVYVYGATPEVVYEGYLPGYLGEYVEPSGVVVFGTGFAYTPWIGALWFGMPFTFGFGVTYFHPWWGPWGWARAHGVAYGWAGPGPGMMHPIYPVRPGVAVAHLNVYHAWHPGVVRSSWYRAAGTERPLHVTRAAPERSATRANNVYADRAGHIYRQGDGGRWEHYSNDGAWHAYGTGAGGAKGAPKGPSITEGAPPHEVLREQMARSAGEARMHGGEMGGSFGGGAMRRRRVR